MGEELLMWGIISQENADLVMYWTAYAIIMTVLAMEAEPQPREHWYS